MSFKKIIYVFLCLAFLTSCYEKGPVVSFRSKTERVSNTWEVSFAFDMNSLGDITQYYSDWNYLLTINQDGSFMETMDSMGQTLSLEGYWTFQKNDQNMRRIYSTGDTLEVYILKLQEKKLWFRTKDNSLELQLRAH